MEIFNTPAFYQLISSFNDHALGLAYLSPYLTSTEKKKKVKIKTINGACLKKFLEDRDGEDSILEIGSNSENLKNGEYYEDLENLEDYNRRKILRKHEGYVWVKIEIEDVKKMMNKIMSIEGIFC